MNKSQQPRHDKKANCVPEIKCPKTGRRGAPQAFPRRLYALLDKEDPKIISWTRDGDAFVINDMGSFTNKTLVKYFNHSNYKSFQRQLNMYNFKKIQRGAQAGAYAHDSFRRGAYDDLEKIRRPKLYFPVGEREAMAEAQRAADGGDSSSAQTGRSSSGGRAIADGEVPVAKRKAPSKRGVSQSATVQATNGSLDSGMANPRLQDANHQMLANFQYACGEDFGNTQVLNQRTGWANTVDSMMGRYIDAGNNWQPLTGQSMLEGDNRLLEASQRGMDFVFNSHQNSMGLLGGGMHCHQSLGDQGAPLGVPVQAQLASPAPQLQQRSDVVDWQWPKPIQPLPIPAYQQLPWKQENLQQLQLQQQQQAGDQWWLRSSSQDFPVGQQQLPHWSSAQQVPTQGTSHNSRKSPQQLQQEELQQHQKLHDEHQQQLQQAQQQQQQQQQGIAADVHDPNLNGDMGNYSWGIWENNINMLAAAQALSAVRQGQVLKLLQERGASNDSTAESSGASSFGSADTGTTAPALSPSSNSNSLEFYNGNGSSPATKSQPSSAYVSQQGGEGGGASNGSQLSSNSNTDISSFFDVDAAASACQELQLMHWAQRPVVPIFDEMLKVAAVHRQQTAAMTQASASIAAEYKDISSVIQRMYMEKLNTVDMEDEELDLNFDLDEFGSDSLDFLAEDGER